MTRINNNLLEQRICTISITTMYELRTLVNVTELCEVRNVIESGDSIINTLKYSEKNDKENELQCSNKN